MLNHLSLPAFALLAVSFSQAAPTAIAADSRIVEEVLIVGYRDDRRSRGATGLDLDLFDTPQSMTTIQADTLDAFKLVDLNSTLGHTTGVNVDATETDRTYYNARGFDITSMHVDGVGVPFGALMVGDLDTAIFESVAVIRGSNGLITGLGNPSGTINYQRKRPSNRFAASTEITGGTWGSVRAVADVSLPLTSSETWAARFVGVHQRKDSWLDLNHGERNVGYLVVDGQVGSSVTVTFALSHQQNDSDGVLWGAAPVIYSDGTLNDFDASTTTSMDWTYWNTQDRTAFAEIGWQVSDAWKLTSSLTHTDYEERSELFYVYWLSGLDRATGLGMYSYPGKYDTDRQTRIWDTALEGTFDAWGQRHELIVGLSMARTDARTLDFAALEGFVAMPAFPGWQGDEVSRPAWDVPIEAARDDMRLNRMYAAARLALSDGLHLLLGVNLVDYENKGVSWGVSTDSSEDGSSPYVGITWSVTDELNLYASYSDIYQPQYYLDESLQPLGSAEGRSYEIGAKQRVGRHGLLTLALFRTEQENLQEFVAYGDGDGIDDTDFSDDFNYALYRGISVDAKGVELEFAGRLSDSLTLQAGYTWLEMKDPHGEDARTFIPRNTLKMLAAWEPAWNDRLSLGLSLRWQDGVHFESSYGRIAQERYAVVGGYVRYRISDKLSLSANVNNLADERYLSSVKYEQAFYAAPRSASLSLNWWLQP